jgi:UDP-N-acetylglucosamine 3-dehydrogenase
MLKMGVLGCGSIALHRHAKEIFENENCSLAACYDPVTERAKEISGLFGGKVCKSAEEVINDKKLDAIVVCTPNKYHSPYTVAALNAGKHVLCEKPMATSHEGAKAMIEAAEKSGKKLMIGHNQRLVPAHIKAREIIASGVLGRIFTFNTTFGHRGAERWSATKNPSTWFFNKEEAVVGTMGDLGVHKADLMRFLLGEEFCEASAFTTTLDKKYENGSFINVDDNAVCILKTKSGIVGTMAASWTYYGAEDNSTVIRGENGAIKIFSNPKWPIEVHYSNKKIKRINAGAIQTNDSQTKSGVLDLFLDCIMNDKPVEISGYEGYKALEVILACMESSRTGKVISF